MKKMIALLLPLFFFSMPMATYANVHTQHTAKLHETSKKNTEMLLVLLAKKATIDVTSNSGTHRLTLSGVNPSVIYFSDRPVRVSGHVSVEKLLGQWKTGEFHKVPPNAVMESIGFDKQTDTLQKNDRRTYAIVLTNPSYDVDKNELSFDIHALEGNKLPLPTDGMSDSVALFIDGVCLTCMGG